MKLVTVAATAAIFLFVATMMPVYAQHDGQDDKRGEKQGKPERPPGRPDKGAPQQQRAPQAEQQHRQQDYKGHQQGMPSSNPNNGSGSSPRVNLNKSSGTSSPSHSSSSSAFNHHSHSNALNSNSNDRPSKLGKNDDRSARSSRPERGSNSKDGYSRAVAGRGTLIGSKLAPNGGPPTIAPGHSAEVTAVTISLRTASVCISAASIPSASARARLCTWAIRVSSTVGFRSCSLIHGRNTGPKTGMPPMTFTSTTTMGTTFTTAGILKSGSPSRLRCS
jgi:hypothetical protein